jgi:uncharacterized protein YbcC (UPF0753/DUF2309 family)
MNTEKGLFDETETLHKLKHYLPFQAALKDFVSQNILRAFQNMKFYDGLNAASQVFGYRTTYSLDEYRELYKTKKIEHDILNNVICQRKGILHLDAWKKLLLEKEYDAVITSQIGQLRARWKEQYHIHIDKIVHAFLIRFTSSYLDQGIAMESFPIKDKSFIDSIRELESNNAVSIFKTNRPRKLLLDSNTSLELLLKIIVGNENYYQHYLFDQQFAHPGISGFISVLESQPETLLDRRNISLHDFILFELLLELDALDNKYGETWKPLCLDMDTPPVKLFENIQQTELTEVISLWQDAFEWTHYDEVLCGIKSTLADERTISNTFQAVMCIDDREYSFRRYIETIDPDSQTYGAPGFFGVEFYFQPENGKFYSKNCPLPVTPKYLIKEQAGKRFRRMDAHYTKRTHAPLQGWIISQTLGFWSAFKLFANIFRPTLTAATSFSFHHMDKHSQLSIEATGEFEGELQVGFTCDEMTIRVHDMLKMIGLVKEFAPIVYIVGHGSSSVNNTHYAAYDCGACSGRPGAVNARVFSAMANRADVRKKLFVYGIKIPDSTQFLGAMHDTTRDEIQFYDEEILSEMNIKLHKINVKTFHQALLLNAKERSRRFDIVNTKMPIQKLHERVKRRSVSLFEPRAELTHTNNSLCIIGRGELTKHLFLDRRPFMNSYDYRIDPDGNSLFTILNAAVPVCAGINLTYYFSRVDNQMLGAGTKLPHNVIGLYAVSNGVEDDLRSGLPSQMVDLHDPIRVLFIVEHYPEIVMDIIKKKAEIYEWFYNEWVHLVVRNPKDNELYLFNEGVFKIYKPIKKALNRINDLTPFIENYPGNIPVLITK